MSKHRRRSKKFRWKRLWLPFGMLTLIGLGIAGWRAAHAPDVNDHFRAAEAARLANEFSAAVIHYKNVLLATPDNLEARWRLGQSYLALEQFPDALTALESAQAFGAQHTEVWLNLAQAQLESGRFAESLRSVGRYTGPAQADADALKVRAKLGLGESAAAKAVLSAATARDPAAASLHLASARLALSERDLAGAAAAIASALTLAPNSPEALLLQGRVALLQGHPAAAATAYRRAADLLKTGTEALAGLSEALLAGGQVDAAAAAIAELDKRAPKTVGVEFLKGWLAYAKQDWATAERVLLGVVKVAPKHPQALLMLADSSFRQAKFNQAEAHLKTFDGLFPGQPQALKMLGALYLKQHRAADAVKVLTPLASHDQPDAGTLALLSYAHYAAGDTAQGKAFLAQAQTLAPDSKLLKTQAALGELAAGHQASGLDELEKLAAGADGGPSRQALTYVHLLQGDTSAALDSARALISLNPDDPMAHNLLGIAHAKNNDHPAAQAAFEKALALNPKFAPALANLGFLALAANAADQGEAYLRQALAADKTYTAASLALAAVVERKGQTAEATQLLTAAITAQPQAAQPKWLLAERLLHAGAVDAALKLAEAAYALTPTAAHSRLLWGAFLLRGGRTLDAIKILQALHAEVPTLLPATAALGHAQRAASHWDLARIHYQEVLQAAPGRLDILWALFAVELGAKDYLAAATVIKTLEDTHPDTADAERARGELAAAQGREAEAISIFDKIFSDTPTTASLMRLLDAQQQGGDTAAAQEAMQQWLTDHPHDTAIRLRLGAVELMAGKTDAAQATFEAALKHAPENPIALNNLAWLYDQAEDERALGLAQRAYQALPNSAEAADTLAWILVRHDGAQQALPLFEKARTLLPAEPNIQFHQAYAWAATGAQDKARDLLKVLFSKPVEFASMNEARALLRRLSTDANAPAGTDPGLRF